MGFYDEKEGFYFEEDVLQIVTESYTTEELELEKILKVEEEVLVVDGITYVGRLEVYTNGDWSFGIDNGNKYESNFNSTLYQLNTQGITLTTSCYVQQGQTTCSDDKQIFLVVQAQAINNIAYGDIPITIHTLKASIIQNETTFSFDEEQEFAIDYYEFGTEDFMITCYNPDASSVAECYLLLPYTEDCCSDRYPL